MVKKESNKPRSGANVENQRQKYKLILKRIGKFQKYLNDMCLVISNHAVKAAGLRDKNDEFAKCLDNFTKVEEFSTTSKLSMAVAAELVATVGDHQDLAIQRVETLVVPNLSSYGRICDCIKRDIWNAIQAIKREKAKKKTVNTLKRKSGDPKVKKALDDAMREFERASAETSRLCQLCQEQVIKFEHKRLMDLKESLGDFIRIQLATHTKSLELLSQTYKHIQSIDEDEDLEILKSTLQIGATIKKRSVSLNRKSSQKSNKSNSAISGAKDEEYVSTSCFSDDSSTDSAHSFAVDYLETVFKSNSKHSTEHTKQKQKHHNVKEKKLKKSKQEKVTGDKGRSKREKRVTKSPTSSESSGSRKRRKKHEKGDKLKRSQQNSPRHYSGGSGLKNKETDDSQTYIPSEEIKRMLGQRPTAPTRPVTVPANMSSAEELTSMTEEMNFRNKNFKNSRAAAWSASPRTGRKSYYYSQSEDDKSKSKVYNRSDEVSDRNAVPHAQDKMKHVSFQPDTANRHSHSHSHSHHSHRMGHHNNRVVSGNGIVSSGAYQSMMNESRDRGDFTRDTQTLFPPVKSSLKKYC